MRAFNEPDPYPMSVSEAFSVRGKVVVVTGAGGWIGHKIAETFAANGATTICSDRAGERLDEAVAEFTAAGLPVHKVPADLSKPEELAALITQTVALGGRVDGLVNCGAIAMSGPLMYDKDEEFDRLFHTNLRSIWLLVRACVPHMEQAGGGGSIVNVSSVNGHRPTFPGPLYTASKAAVLNMTECMAGELADKRIRVNSVSPGAIFNVERNMRWWRDQLKEPYATQYLNWVMPRATEAGSTAQPLPVAGRPIDIAMAALYLCSPAARFITGTDILVDGALLLEWQRVQRERPRDPFWATMREYLKTFPEEAWKEKRPEWLDRKPEQGPAGRSPSSGQSTPAGQTTQAVAVVRPSGG